MTVAEDRSFIILNCDRLRRRRRRLSPDFPLGVELETFIRREDAEGFIEEVRSDDPEIAVKLRIETRELEAGGD